MDVCSDCLYFRKHKGFEGNCHRYPPTHDVSLPRFPKVMTMDWCGEFAPKRQYKEGA